MTTTRLRVVVNGSFGEGGVGLELGHDELRDETGDLVVVVGELLDVDDGA